MGQLEDENGKSISPILFEAIVKERYLIAKKANISYADTGSMSVSERKMLIKFITEEIEAHNKAIAEMQSKKR